MGRSEEQAARNEIVFRDANEKIADRRAELDAITGPTPFLCECEDPACTAIVRLTAEEYLAIRSEPTQFLVVSGHPTQGVATGFGGEGWQAVRKVGIGGALARETARAEDG